MGRIIAPRFAANFPFKITGRNRNIIIFDARSRKLGAIIAALKGSQILSKFSYGRVPGHAGHVRLIYQRQKSSEKAGIRRSPAADRKDVTRIILRHGNNRLFNHRKSPRVHDPGAQPQGFSGFQKYFSSRNSANGLDVGSPSTDVTNNLAEKYKFP